LGQRSSYSKTDPDATFMRLKDDHMQNGQLKPAYNWQVSTANQYVTHYSIHQTTTDTTLLKEHLNSFQEQYQQMPESITADAGYGSEENYEFLEEKKIEAFVKFNLFHHEQTDKFKAQINKIDNLFYNQLFYYHLYLYRTSNLDDSMFLSETSQIVSDYKPSKVAFTASKFGKSPALSKTSAYLIVPDASITKAERLATPCIPKTKVS
jgi:hypothetical protein